MNKLCMIFVINLLDAKFVMNWGWGGGGGGATHSIYGKKMLRALGALGVLDIRHKKQK
jgi:hypothetical protein